MSLCVNFKTVFKNKGIWYNLDMNEETKQEKHYICKGGCRGVSPVPGACQAPDCANHNHELVECNCTDGLHNDFK